MIRIDKSEMIEGLTVFTDDSSDYTFFVLPNEPTFRFVDNKPVFQFLKYRFPIDRPDGKKGGGIAFFDVEFVIPDAKLKAIVTALQDRVNKKYSARGISPAPAVVIGKLTFTKGKASLNLENVSGDLVQKIWNPGSPSLYGNYITPFTAEFTPEGATVFEQALKGKGGAIQVAYDLWTPAKLPPVTVRGDWSASKFYQFYQKIDQNTGWLRDDTYTETVREQVHNSEFYQITFDWGGITDSKIQSTIRESVQKTFDDEIARGMIKDATPVSDENRKLPEGVDHLTRDIVNSKHADVHVRYTEGVVIDWNPAPRGTLPNITNYAGVKWEDYYKEIDADDKFYKRLTVDVMVNADFKELPIDSVVITIDYDPNDTKGNSFIFHSNSEVFHYMHYNVNNKYIYNYKYTINYKGFAKPLTKSVQGVNDRALVLNVDDTGILMVTVLPGDIDFNKVKEVQGTLTYSDAGVEPVEEQFTLTKDTKEVKIIRVLGQDVRNQYSYTLKYNMIDGKEFVPKNPLKSQSQRLFINDPFVDTKTVSIRSIGNWEKDLNTIYIDLKYEDPGNDYKRTSTIALSKDKPFIDWTFPVLSETGTVKYSSTVVYKNGTTEQNPEKTATSDAIYVGPIDQDFLEVKVSPKLVDFTKVDLVIVSMKYQDTGNNIDEKEEIEVTASNQVIPSWVVGIKDKTKDKYEWSAAYYMKDGSEKTVKSDGPTDKLTIVLKVPQ